MNIIIIPITLLLVWIFYIIVRFKHTETKYTLLEILRDTENPKIINNQDFAQSLGYQTIHSKELATIRVY